MLGDPFLGFYLLVLWTVLCVVVGLSAGRHYDRNSFAWFLVALFASPIFGYGCWSWSAASRPSR